MCDRWSLTRIRLRRPQAHSRKHGKPENAEASIRTRGICEAGCSLFWVTPLAQKDWDSEVTWAAVVRGTSLLKPKSLEGSVRILWPFTLQCVTADVLPADNYPKALEMVHGNVLLYSWWVDIYPCVSRQRLRACVHAARVRSLRHRQPAAAAASEVGSHREIHLGGLGHQGKCPTSSRSRATSSPSKVGFLIEELPAGTRSSQKKILEALQGDYKEVPLKYQGKVLNKHRKRFPKSGARYLSLIFQMVGSGAFELWWALQNGDDSGWVCQRSGELRPLAAGCVLFDRLLAVHKIIIIGYETNSMDAPLCRPTCLTSSPSCCTSMRKSTHELT